MTIKFPDMHLPRPDLDAMELAINEIQGSINNSTDSAGVMAAIGTWEKVRRTFSTWEALTSAHYTQDTKNAEYKTENDFLDEIQAQVTELNQRVIKALLDSPHRAGVEAELGPHAFNLWQTEITTFKPEIAEDLVKESKLRTEFTELQSSAEIEFEGETYNLSSIGKFFEGADRDQRYRAQKARWDWVEAHAESYDRIYDELVQVRHGIAQKLGYENFIELGYRRMARTDYNKSDVEVFRKQVRDHIVPLAKKTYEAQSKRLGLDSLMVWDTPVYDETGNPKPNGGVAELTEFAGEMFNEMHPELGDFYNLMVDRQLLDLDTRPGKSGGGYCTTFADYGVPFIFANFTGNKHDAEVFTHEMGHAFQCYLSMNKPLFEYVWPTMEACEIHSMSLEFLTWPHMDLFFGDDADRFRKIHLTQSLQFIHTERPSTTSNTSFTRTPVLRRRSDMRCGRRWRRLTSHG